MKYLQKSILILVTIIVITLAIPQGVQAAPTADDRTVIGESYTLESGRILDGDLNVIGGVVEIKPTATVNGNMFVLGGLVTIDGTINGNLTVIGGTVNLNQNAVIEGDLISPVSYVNIDPNASIRGDQIEEWILPGLDVERFFNVRPSIIRTRTFAILPIVTQAAKTLATTLVLTALGAFLLLIMPKPADRMRQALVSSPWHILGYGALTALVMLVLGVFLFITICLIPVLILIGLTFALAILIGWLVLGYELGQRITSTIFKTTWHPVLSAALGNLLLYLVAKGVSLIPCLGWFLVFIAMLFSLGMTIVTLFGTYPYPRTANDGDADERVVLFERERSVEPEPPTIDEPEAVIVPPPSPPVEPHFNNNVPVEPIDDQPEIPIEALNLGTRINNTLKDAGLTTVKAVLKQLEYGDEHMLGISGFGDKSLDDLKEALRKMGNYIPGSSDE
jgi:hypothetical protein